MSRLRINRRLLTLGLLVAVMIGITAVPPQSLADEAVFSDVREHWAGNTILWAYDMRIVAGYEDGTFRPNRLVSEAEFYTMLIRAYPNIKVPSPKAGSRWYTTYFEAARLMGWPVIHDITGTSFNRGHAARIIAATQGQTLEEDAAIQYLLDHSLSHGKYSSTLRGYAKNEKLTRAEALTFIYNLKRRGVKLTAAQFTAEKLFSIRAIAIGDSEERVLNLLGQPDRKDLSEYGFQWYIYNSNYSSYVQVGLKNGVVVGLYTNAGNILSKDGIQIGTPRTRVSELYGKPLEYIEKGNTRFMLPYEQSEAAVYLIENSFITFFYDIHNGSTLTALQIIEAGTELSLQSFYGDPSEALRTSFEKQSFDLANVDRVRRGLNPFAYDGAISVTARNHSKDMSLEGYFNHHNLSGLSPFDRMELDGIEFSAASENIAAGQTSAIFAHAGWMNSEGHRKNILGDYARLGTGVYFGGKGHVYYTQNFYTPLK
jgi:uncharacterized protein YkwD